MKEMNTNDAKPVFIDIKKSWDLNHWCQELNLRSDELIRIIRRVGPSLSEIKRFIENGPSKDILKH